PEKKAFRPCPSRCFPTGGRGKNSRFLGPAKDLRKVGPSPSIRLSWPNIRQRKEGRGETLFLLRRPPLRDRPSALRPPSRRHPERHRPPLLDDEGLLDPASLRMGLPRSAGRIRNQQSPRREVEQRRLRDGRREIQRSLPRNRPALLPRMEAHRPPHRPMGRHGERLLHHVP